MHVVDFDRYRLRLSLECLLVGTEERTCRAFDVYSAELVRDDETICATTERARFVMKMRAKGHNLDEIAELIETR